MAPSRHPGRARYGPPFMTAKAAYGPPRPRERPAGTASMKPLLRPRKSRLNESASGSDPPRSWRQTDCIGLTAPIPFLACGKT